MCLAIPGRIVAIERPGATVDFGGLSRSICIDLTPDVRNGDYVLVHAGFAIHRLEPGEAADVLALFEEVDREPVEDIP